MNPQRFFAVIFLTKNRGYRNEILAICQWINNKSIDFNKMQHCPYMREAERSILRTSALKEIAKNRHFFSVLFVITQHIKELVSRKFSGLLRIIFQLWRSKNKIFNFF